VLLVDGHAAFTKSFDPDFVIVHAQDAMADLGKTYRRDKPHVPGADHTDGNGL
jgi:hypothetical protein